MPTYTKTLLCLANSWKTSGRCIAGKEISDGRIGDWIRPVSAREHGELSEDERHFANGSDPRILDVITVPFKRPHPHGFQCENHLIDPTRHWVFERRATDQEVRAALDLTGTRLWQGGSSSAHGRNDRVREDQAVLAEGSLRFIEVDDLTVQIQVEGAEYDNAKRKMRGRFSYHGTDYVLGITDPVLRREYFLNRGDGHHPFGRARLCVSLGEPYLGNAYKLIAAVIPPSN